jgi:signal transduction histidine kinase
MPSNEAQQDAKPRVLLIDDHALLLRSLVATVEERMPQVAVMGISSAQLALQQIRATDVDVVVTDVMMPQIHGLQVLGFVREVRPDAPVILITGADERDLAIRALRGGAYDLILKPVDPDYFVASLGRALEKRNLVRDLARREQQLREHAEELERTVAERTHELSEANRLKDEFLATVSHELRTPLTPVLGWARLLRSQRIDSATFQEAVDSIERNARAQAQLIDDLLDVSRIVTGKLRLDVQALELASVLDEAIDVVLPAARAKDIVVSRCGVRAGPILMEGDPERLRQVFWNLLANAVKFTPVGGRITVEVQCLTGTARVCVRDTGVGIKSDFLPFVFDRFRQAGGPGSRTGLGLGLAIVKHLVERHGGTVEASSEGEQRGATFAVTLPGCQFVADSDVVPAPRRNGRAEAAPISRCLVGVHVLLLEDIPDTRRVLSKALELAGARVTAVSTAAEAWSVIRTARPHVLLCDIGLGDDGDGGYAFVSRLRELPADEGGAIPAIALTAFAKPEDRKRALASGFQIHIAKPGPANLGMVIARLLSKMQATCAPV